MTKAKVSVIWRGSRGRGSALLAAICPDDPDDFHAELVGEGDSVELKISIESGGLGQSRATVDDILACLSAAESGLDSIE
ncbi:MAG: hypothetical protein CMA88_02910 [Euryarchaeota archaeon]|nr:hypothetical protein [Euryarchaeota archaeon]|tara:strand:+ start:3251 stop:3490 length:240 start_codon:yes stop_codon:yes gene_type:complete